MKTRIIYPKNIWYNKEFSKLKVTDRLLCFYLVTNENIGLTRYYKQHDMEICFLLGMSQKQLDESKATISKRGLFYFCNEWVFINNDFSYCDYNGRDKLMESKQKELDSIPVDIIEFFKGVNKGLISGYQPPINNKYKIINNKQEKENKKFNEFWERYPKKIARSKVEKKYPNEKHEEVMKGLESYLSYWREKKTEIQYIPNPETWLNQERWTDELGKKIAVEPKKAKGIDFFGGVVNT